ncbi:MAG: RNA polymerase sigma-54 factor [Cryomorphaceae bacterium]|nr:MAG: RNA polymerase sigma-54 factor [Cryomorphaceae bacterium]
MNKQRLQQKQYQNLSPQQIQFLGLLQIPIVALEKRIEEELEENPTLEEEEEQKEINLSERSIQQHNKDDIQFQIEDKSESLSDYLSQQLIAVDIDEKQLFLVNYLINSLDDNGFLNRDLHSITSDLLISNSLDVNEQQVRNALEIVQQLEPFGVGARNLQECLLIQIKNIHPEKELEKEIISNYYIPFSNKNFEYLAKQLKLNLNSLKKAYLTIESLNPMPGNGFSKNTEGITYVYPDFSVVFNDGKLELKLNNSNVKPIKVSTYYQNMLKETSDEATKKFLVDKLDKANWFKDAIAKRNDTLKNVVTAILGIQESYFISGNEKDLKPMKLADIAQIVNMDISTISRVSNSKYIATNFGTFKLKELFSEAYRKDNGEIISTKEIKKRLQEIIVSEDKINPLTDEKLAQLLGKDDYHIARRTVAKYRENLNIQIAKLRREI